MYAQLFDSAVVFLFSFSFRNIGCLVLKLFAWHYTGSHTMFSELLHSVADTANQLVLAVGVHTSTKVTKHTRARPSVPVLSSANSGKTKAKYNPIFQACFAGLIALEINRIVSAYIKCMRTFLLYLKLKVFKRSCTLE